MSKRIFAMVLVLGLVGGGLAVARPLMGTPTADPSGGLGAFDEPQPESTPPGHQETPGKKKGCNKGKGKKKGCNKIVKPQAGVAVGSGSGLQPCSTWRPGGLGRGAPSYKLTESHGYFSLITLSVEQPGGIKTGLPSDEGTGGDTYFNVQVEPSTSHTGLWARLDFAERRDYDLILYDREGNEVASSRGFNPVHEEASMLSPESQGGESTNSSETLRGIRSSRCEGYTIDVSSAAAEGGDVTLKLWLGPIGYTPPSAKRG